MWSTDAKLEIVLLTIKGETTINDICQRFKVAAMQVHAWRKQLLEQGSQTYAKSNKAAEAASTEFEHMQS